MNNDLDSLMLDALRRGILLSKKGSAVVKESTNLNHLRASICKNGPQLSRENGMKVLCAISTIAGIDAIGAFNNGCSVDISRWSLEQLTKLNDVIQFVSK
jgi:hypothetical protein